MIGIGLRSANSILQKLALNIFMSFLAKQLKEIKGIFYHFAWISKNVKLILDYSQWEWVVLSKRDLKPSSDITPVK